MTWFRKKTLTQSLQSVKGTLKATKTWGKTQIERLGNWFFPHQEEEEEEENRYLQGLLGIVLWFAFAAFLLASLPHVAYFFASFEPEDAKGNVSDYWWIIAYILAGSIDITSFLLSLNLANKMKRATRGLNWIQKIGVVIRIALIHWPFIVALVGFSWLVNFEHATEFHSTMLGLAEDVQINLFFWQGTLHDLNPVIASAFPVLAVAYTGMADDAKGVNKKFMNTSVNVNAPTLPIVNDVIPSVNDPKNEQTEVMIALFTEIREQQKRANEQNTLFISEMKNVLRSLPEHSSVNRNIVHEQGVPRKKIHRSRVIHTQLMNDEQGAFEQETEEIQAFTSSNSQKQQSVHVSSPLHEEEIQETVNDEEERTDKASMKERVRTELLNNPKMTISELEAFTGKSRGYVHKLKQTVEAEIHSLGITGRTVNAVVHKPVNDQ